MTRPDLTLVAFSDTHGLHAEMDHAIPDGDVLIHAGDFCGRGLMEEVREFAAWMGAFPHRHKLVTAGNHDRPVEDDEAGCRAVFAENGIRLLIGESVKIEGYQFYGAPYTPTFMNWHFMRERGAEIRAEWETIPDDADVAFTHGPAYGHGDQTIPWRGDPPRHAGCLELLTRLRAVQPNVHIFGHIHEGYGATISDELPATRFFNASACSSSYRPENAPFRFQLRGT
jgi:Icc-related predicted phosphoesterase